MTTGRFDLQYATTERGSPICTPTVKDWTKRSTTERYLISRPSLQYKYDAQEYLNTDAVATRASNAVIHGGRDLRSWSNTQPLVVRSLVESEVFAIVIHRLRHWLFAECCKSWGDAWRNHTYSNARGARHRSPPRAWHIGAHGHQLLFAQQYNAKKAFQYPKVTGG